MIFGAFFKNVFKYFFLTILCLVPVVILGAGVYCGVALYKEKTNVSKTYGELNEHDLYEDFNVFDCDLSNAIFYQTTTGYEYTTTIPKAVEFNGSTSKYNVLVNDQPSSNEQSSAGILTAKNTINYYGIDGNLLNQTVLTIEFKFYQSRVEIVIKNTNTAEQQALFLEYMQFNGLKIRTIESQYIPAVSTSEYFTITFLGKDGEKISTSRVAKGATITVPDAPKYLDYDFDGWTPAVPTYATQNATFTAVYTEAKHVFRFIINNQVVAAISQKELEKNCSTSSLDSITYVRCMTESELTQSAKVEGKLLQNCYDFTWTKDVEQHMTENNIGTQPDVSGQFGFGYSVTINCYNEKNMPLISIEKHVGIIYNYVGTTYSVDTTYYHTDTQY